MGPSDEEQHDWWGKFIRPLIITTLVAFAPTPIVAVVVSVVSDFGGNVNIEFYSVVAGVLPILLLTLLVERAWVDQAFRVESEEQTEDEAMQRLGLNWAATVAFALNFATGEVAALYAIASHDSSTLLLMLSVISLVVLFGFLLFYHLGRYVPEPSKPPESD